MADSKKTVLITGASSGIGFDAARALAEAGYNVHGTTRKDATDGFGFSMHTADVRDATAMQALVNQINEKSGSIDILINNAGVGYRGAVEESEPEQARQLFETNFFGVLNTTQAVLPAMRERREGLIINIGSIGGLIALPFNSIYCASKFALEGFTQTLRLEVAQFGITVAMINPGFIVTKFADSAEYAPEMEQYAQLRKSGQERIANGLGSGPDPSIVTEAIREIIDEGVGEANYIVGEDASGLLDKWNELSPDAFAEMMRRQFGI